MKNPDELLYDALRERYVAVNNDRSIALIFEKDNDDMTVITIIYSTEVRDMVNRRKRAGRWI